MATSHDWSEKEFDWKGINEAADYIGQTLNKYRVVVSDYKEKWGQARAYVRFGWYSIHDLTHPGYAYIHYKSKFLVWLNYNRVQCKFFQLLNHIVIPIQQKIYVHVYKQALRKWPHLAGEILMGADESAMLAHLDSRMIVSRIDRVTHVSWEGDSDDIDSN